MKNDKPISLILCTIFLTTSFLSSEDINMTKEIIFTDKAPKTSGPYSQAVKSNGFLFVSGQLTLHPETGDLMNDSIEEQATQVRQHLTTDYKRPNQSPKEIIRIPI